MLKILAREETLKCVYYDLHKGWRWFKALGSLARSTTAQDPLPQDRALKKKGSSPNVVDLAKDPST
ncbi:MAG: hypothetical protein ACKOOI_03465, partial [Pirellula sp.]